MDVDSDYITSGLFDKFNRRYDDMLKFGISKKEAEFKRKMSLKD